MATQYVSDEFMKELNKYVPKEAIASAWIKTKNNTNTTNDGIWTITVGNTCNGWTYVTETYDNNTLNVMAKQFIPVKIIFNPPTTICYFPDGTKTVVKCADDEKFVEEEGVMACIIKKLFPSRNAFKKLVATAYKQPPKLPKKYYKKDQWG
jgi:hypothetical protein